MTTHYKTPLNRKEWSRYAELRDRYKAKEISHAEFIFMRGIVLETGSLTNLESTYSGYFLGLMEKKRGNERFTDDAINSILQKAKATHRKNEHYLYEEDAGELFRKYPVKWQNYRAYDESYNCYDCQTLKTVLPWKLTKEEEVEFREQFSVEYYDPYCDGRDCTGAPFTSWMRFLRCSDRTVILHRINYDV
jgi:hypothetical protein